MDEYWQNNVCAADDVLPWKQFDPIVAKYNGDKGAKSLNCSEQFRILAFAQLTYRESLRHIETCLAVQSKKLYHIGLRQPVSRSTLADANEARDWRIPGVLGNKEFAQNIQDAKEMVVVT